MGILKSTNKVPGSVDEIKATLSATAQTGHKEKETTAMPPSQAPSPTPKSSPKEEANPPKPAEKPTLEKVEEQLTAFAQVLKAENVPTYLTTLFEGSPLVWDGENRICISFENPLLENAFRDHHIRAERFLAEKLHFPISLSYKITEISQERKLYTDSEKMNFLLGKYPAFAALKDSLGLDLDS